MRTFQIVEMNLFISETVAEDEITKSTFEKDGVVGLAADGTLGGALKAVTGSPDCLLIELNLASLVLILLAQGESCPLITPAILTRSEPINFCKASTVERCSGGYSRRRKRTSAWAIK
jgi:hypothetical protein